MIALLCWFVGLALGQEPVAEQRRLQEELLKHAQRNSWPAVDDTYERILGLGLPASSRDHLLGAQAAMDSGHALLAWHRLQRLRTPNANEPKDMVDAHTAASNLETSLERRYGLVSVYVRSGKLAALVRPHMPFAQEERDVIAAAREALRTQRAYRGLLPEGVYLVDGHRFQVDANWNDWKVVVVGDVTTVDAPRPDYIAPGQTPDAPE